MALRQDALASRMREVLKGTEGTRVDKPRKTAEIRVKGLECSISKKEVEEAIAEKVGCSTDDIQLGNIVKGPRGQGNLWAKIPLERVYKVIDDGYIRVGWSRARVELLRQRPLRCFRCLEQGHVKETCQNAVDRSGKCYRCNSRNHNARGCTATPRCPLCIDLNRTHNYVLGSEQCAPKPKRIQGRQVQQETSLPQRSPRVYKEAKVQDTNVEIDVVQEQNTSRNILEEDSTDQQKRL